jgi:N-acetylglucosamine-6-phosphate deacetylase
MPAIGHTMAHYEQVCQAINLGATQATHTFNAMSAMHHRAPGAVGAVLTHDAITCEIIADMVHVHPAVVKLAIRAKGYDKIVLITDAEAGAGMKPGTYNFDEHTLQVTHAGVYLADGTLAGSVLTMNEALYNCVHVLNISLADAWPMTSYNAAKQIGLDHIKGKLAVGYDADIAVLNPADYSVEMTLCSGEVVYTKQKNILLNERNNERSDSWPTRLIF